MPHSSIIAATRQISASVAQHQKVSAALDNAYAAHARIVDRLAALDAKRAGIITRRQRGDAQPDDGADLMLIEADRQGLAAMLTDADGVVNAARAPVQQSANAVAMAREALQQVEAELEETALAAHAAKLDGLLLETVTRLSNIGTRLRRTQPIWGPSRDLSDGLRRLQLQRGEI